MNQRRMGAEPLRNEDDVRYGMLTVIQMVAEYDSQIAPTTGGYRLSDMLACKLNLTRRNRPRKAPRRRTTIKAEEGQV